MMFIFVVLTFGKSMEIKLIVIGKTTDSYLVEGEEKYEAKLKHYIKFSQDTIIKKTKHLNVEQLKDTQAKLIIDKLKPNDFIVLLDEKGKEFNSIGFSQFLNQSMTKGIKRLVFIIGGAYGFDKNLYQLAHHKIALSKMTFSHQMVRLIFKEQLYRGLSILKNEPYHH